MPKFAFLTGAGCRTPADPHHFRTASHCCAASQLLRPLTIEIVAVRGALAGHTVNEHLA